MRELLPGIGFSTPSTNAKEGEEGARRKWEGARETWPDFQSCRIKCSSRSCASSKPLPRGYLKIDCGGPTSHAHPCKCFAPSCLVKALWNHQHCSRAGSTQHQLLPKPQHPRETQTPRGERQHPWLWHLFPFPTLSISVNGLLQLQPRKCFQDPSAHFAKWKQIC